jgi:hypothetical protein
MLAIDEADLDVWAKEVASEKAEVDLVNRKKKAAESGGGFFGRMWGRSSSAPEVKPEQKKAE